MDQSAGEKPPKLRLHTGLQNPLAREEGTSSLGSTDVPGSPRKHHHLFHHGDGHTRGKDTLVKEHKTGFLPFRTHLRPPAVVNGPNKFASKATSVKGSTAAPDASGRNSLSISGGLEPWKARKHPASSDDVVREKELNRRRDQALRNALNELSDVAQESARRLDFTYYTILEKVGSLQASISEMQDLSTAANHALDEFQKNSQGIETEMVSQIEGFGTFQQQRERLKGLQDRIATGVVQADELNARLEHAQKRAEEWDREEDEWQARTSIRLRIGWASMLTVIILVFGLITLKRSYFQWSNTEQTTYIRGNRLLEELRSLALKENQISFSLPESRTTPEVRLQVFDEL